MTRVSRLADRPTIPALRYVSIKPRMCSATALRQIVMKPDLGHSLGASLAEAQDVAQTWGQLGNLLGDGSGPDFIWEAQSIWD